MYRAFSGIVLVLWTPLSPVARDQTRPTGSPVGIWVGVLKGGPLNGSVAFQVNKDKDGKLSGKAHFIQERVVFPLQAVTFAGGKLAVNLGKGDTYIGILDKNGASITGTLKLLGQTVRLRLDRVNKLPILKRPQEPKGPLPYLAEDVTFDNESAKVKLAGTLTLPRGDGPFPAVVLLSGSGPHDRDSTMAGHKPFLVLADHLARQGIGCLRVDKRGIGKSGGKYVGTTGAEFAADAHAALKYLQRNKKIDRKRIGLCGHSEGGASAALVAADHPGDVAFLVLLAAPGISGEQLLYEQMLLALKLIDARTDAKEVKKLTTAMVAILKSAKTTQELQKDLLQPLSEYVRTMKDKEIGKKLKAGAPYFAHNYSDPGRRWLITYDPAASLKKVKCPVLALNGSKDTVVKARQNLEASEAALKAGGNQKVTCAELSGLNHLFQTCKTGFQAEYNQLEETFAPAALKRISAWIAERK